MKEASFNCLFTAITWMLFCAIASLAYLSWTKPSGETPQATEVVVYHHHIEPQPVLQSPLFPYDLPRPREPAEPTFEPRPEEPILEIGERRDGLIPRFLRPLVDLRVALPERGPRPPRAAAFPVQRERLLTEMSDRERMAIMDWEEWQERYREQRESDRYYARLYDENEAVRASKAAALAKEEEAARQSHAGEERPKTADTIGSNNATEDGKSSPTRIDEITTKTADTVGSNNATEDVKSSPTRIDETTAKTADTVGSNAAPQDGQTSPTRIDETTTKTAATIDSTTAPQDGQNERKNAKLTINPHIAPYSGGSEAMQGDQPISGNNTQSDALKGADQC
jgi:hypothetical protein